MNEVVDASQACDALHEAAELNREDPIREGSLLNFGGAGQLVMTGDMHGHLRNFEKLKRYCALESSPGRCVVLHELIHADLEPPDYLDLSIDLLVQAALWKGAHPDNVFFLQSNHELAQLDGHEITKGGRSVLHDFARGVEHRFGDAVGDVLEGVNDYVSSLPLGGRTSRGIFLSHSLPSAAQMADFDITVFDRQPTPADLQPGGPAYELVWGRFQYEDEIERFAERLGVETFVVGHTPQEAGFDVIGRMVIVASDHNHGVFLPIDLGREYTAADLAERMRKFVSVE